MTEKRFECDKGSRIIIDNETKLHYIMTLDWECRLVTKLLNNFVEENEQLKQTISGWKCSYDELYQDIKILEKENEQLKIRNKGKQAFIDKQNKIIKLLYNQCKDFKEILDDSNITYPIDEKLNKFFEKGVKL